MKKDFYKVTELTGRIEEFADSVLQEAEECDPRTRVHLRILSNQLRVQMAIAQQITMVAQHLGDIVEKLNEGKPKQWRDHVRRRGMSGLPDEEKG